MSVLAELIAVLAPPACAACGAALDEAAALVCSPCLRDLRRLDARVCRRCALPYHGGRACPAGGAAFATAWAPVAYEGPGRDLVHALKFRGALPVAGFMAAQIAATMPAWARGRGPRGGDSPGPGQSAGLAAGGARPGGGAAGAAAGLAIVPVPAAPERRRRRGFDSAELLARELARRTGLPLVACLGRGRGSPRQLGARRAERRAAGRVIVTAIAPPPAAALLLDDVHTTGATLDACARVLLAAGAARIHAVSYARAL